MDNSKIYKRAIKKARKIQAMQIAKQEKQEPKKKYKPSPFKSALNHRASVEEKAEEIKKARMKAEKEKGKKRIIERLKGLK